jgi:lipooligosaccharide transport system ATP-binding protein
MPDAHAASARPAAPAVEARGLTKRYGELMAVGGIDFCVERQELFGFLGPNGAGKSTSMNMIYGRAPLSGGSLHVLGLDVTHPSQARQIRARLGVVPQDNNLDPDLTAMENLLVYARYFDVPRRVAIERAEQLLELFQLTERRNSGVEELSGGMRRRLVIARAFVNDAELVILDEPTTGLDPQARLLVWQQLRYLKQQGVTMLLTTHYMEEAARLCDRLVIMDRGRILSQGSPADLIRRHVGDEVVELRVEPEARNSIRAQLDGTMQVEEAGDTLYVFAGQVEARALRERLDLTEVTGVLLRPATLEDVFMRLTGRALNE